MIPDLDIFRSAQVLVKRHGPDAPIEAAMRADAMLEKGDLRGVEAGTAGGGGATASEAKRGNFTEPLPYK